MVSINRRTNCSNQQLFKCTYSPVSKTKLRTCELILLVFLFSLLHILRGGQVPNYANAKQSATKILFKHQLQSVPSLNKKKNRNTFNSLACHTNCRSAFPAVWLKVQSHQVANYKECVITVIIFTMTVPGCAVTLAHLIKPISVSVMFAS